MFFSAATSKADVLSSSTTSLGRLVINRPNAKRCCSPNDKVLLQSSTVSIPQKGSPLPALLATCSRSTLFKTLIRSLSDHSFQSQYPSPGGEPPSGRSLTPIPGRVQSSLRPVLGYSNWSRSDPGGQYLMNNERQLGLRVALRRSKCSQEDTQKKSAFEGR